MNARTQWIPKIFALLVFAAAAAHGQAVDVKALAETMRQGGYVIVLRHGATKNDRRAEALKTMAATAPEAGGNTLLVTHKPNILDAFGKEWFDVKEGEASIFRPDGAGKAILVARIQAVDWVKAAK